MNDHISNMIRLPNVSSYVIPYASREAYGLQQSFELLDALPSAGTSASVEFLNQETHPLFFIERLKINEGNPYFLQSLTLQ